MDSDNVAGEAWMPGWIQLRSREERHMLDVILVAVGCGTFVLAIAYAYACDKL